MTSVEAFPREPQPINRRRSPALGDVLEGVDGSFAVLSCLSPERWITTDYNGNINGEADSREAAQAMLGTEPKRLAGKIVPKDQLPPGHRPKHPRIVLGYSHTKRRR